MLRPTLLLVMLLAPTASAAGDAFSVHMEATEKMSKPQSTVIFPAAITSHSPDQLKLSFELVARDGRLRPVTPPGIVLDEAGGRQSQTTVMFMVQTPYENGRLNETGRVMFRITANDPLTNETRADPYDITLTVHTAGVYVPGPQMFGAMLAIGLAAFLHRRASRDRPEDPPSKGPKF